jgi:hypothetical protein
VETPRAWPITVLFLEGGPDDGETRLTPVYSGLEPPGALEPTTTAPGRYVRLKEPDDGLWRYLWTFDWEVLPSLVPARRPDFLDAVPADRPTRHRRREE